MLNPNYQQFHSNILKTIPNDRVFTDPLHTLAYGTDASFYRLVPKIIIKAISETEVITILKYANILELPVVFRAAGTSLSGQAISDSILVICSFGFRGIKIVDDAKAIELEPGVVGAHANEALKFFGKKIGPDPASISAAQIGGIAANNASGMCCGIDQNSYKTLKSLRVIFADGTLLDTSDPKSIENFKTTNSKIVQKIRELLYEVQTNKPLYEKIQKKYSIKNTTGYSLNALIDFEDEIDVIAHLIIGSEGTLGFISKITFHTVDEPKYKSSAMILFDDIYEACKFVQELKTHHELVNAAELMDRASIKSVETKDGVDPIYKTLHQNACAILVECGALSLENLNLKTQHVTQIANHYTLITPVTFFNDPKEYSKLWALRKGTFPTVGAMRESGTTAIIEDVAFRIEDLADGIIELQQLFAKYNYHEAIIFGHALEGNIHFVFTQEFEHQDQIKRYESFMDEVCNLVATKYKGSLKAEHGTGRNMAPYVELEWGEDAYALMKSIKTIFDPNNLLNPGVIINNDPKAHIKNLKYMTAFDPIADKCIECGFCEPICPSKDLTLTPRQRIAVNREIAYREKTNQSTKDLKDLYIYNGEQTCAVDGLCATSCPVGINTGALTKHIRSTHNSNITNNIASKIAQNYATTLKLVRSGMQVANLLEKLIQPKGFRAIRKIIPSFPYWLDSMPNVAKITKPNPTHFDNKVVYFSSCINRVFGASKQNSDQRDLLSVVDSLLQKANYELIYCDDENLCCGVPFESKGFQAQADLQLEKLLKQLQKLSNNGEYPILCDNSPCTYRIVNNLKDLNLKVYEPIEFSLQYLVPKLKINQTNEPIVIHTTCSSKKMQLDRSFETLAKLLSSDVTIPVNINCCGFAGDRGFSYPQLNASALANLKPQLKPDIKRGFSTSKTCEMGLSHNSERDYGSILYLLDQNSDAKI
ncbi:MAG: FAD-binding oxidoreductase [Campylobacterales bacterium]|nr:FAD-binding oxidoreductase [Campylobacterales bacterium]